MFVTNIQFAARNRFDLKIMDLKWIEAAYEKWIQGEDVNFEEVGITSVSTGLTL
jgi:hypothetical protein